MHYNGYYVQCIWIYIFLLAGENKCVMGGGGLSKILENVIGFRIAERVGYHCPRLMMNILIRYAWKH